MADNPFSTPESSAPASLRRNSSPFPDGRIAQPLPTHPGLTVERGTAVPIQQLPAQDDEIVSPPLRSGDSTLTVISGCRRVTSRQPSHECALE